jgi:protein involved in polysaccharide export with SLBB domain
MCCLRVTIRDLHVRRAVLLLGLCALGPGLSGCNNKLLDPSQIGRFRPTPAVNVILNSLGVAEETPVAWEKAQEPQPGDIVAVPADYALRPGDLVRISIFELYQEGTAVVNDYVISETGQVSIPNVGVIQAAGLTERQLEDEIKRILSPDVLRNPSVTVTLLDSQQRTFSILGNAVARPGRYLIPRYDFRLTDALATAGARMQFNVSNIYVSRREETAAPPAGPTRQKQTPELGLVEPGAQSKAPNAGLGVGGTGRGAAPSAVRRHPWAEIPDPSEPAQEFESEREMLDLIAPRAQGIWPRSEKLAAAVPTSGEPGDVTASVMPERSRGHAFGAAERWPGSSRPSQGVRVSLQVQGQDAPATGTWGGKAIPVVGPYPVPSAHVVQTPVEFGSLNPGPGPQNPVPAPAGPEAQERTEWVFRDGKWVPIVVREEGSRPPSVPGPSEKPVTPPGGGIKWIFRDGQWIPVPKGETRPTQPPTVVGPPPAGRPAGPPAPPPETQWEQAILTRLIRIPADKLLAGDPRFNIIIKPGDTIHVPVDIIGEFAIMGNVNRSGYIDITGRPMTLKMAIAAAGGLGPLAVPKNVEVIRRIGTAREEIVLVDLDRIASGEQPDFFIKPNDLINVGTDPTARWRAVLRNAFRATYGFGFVYDRNFADVDYGTDFPWLRYF